MGTIDVRMLETRWSSQCTKTRNRSYELMSLLYVSNGLGPIDTLQTAEPSTNFKSVILIATYRQQ